MKHYRNIKLSINSLFSNKSRTWFSIAGMAVGIAAVIVTVAIGEASKQKALKPLEEMGTNMISISSAKFTEARNRQREISTYTTLKPNDVKDIGEINLVQCVSGFQELNLQVSFQGNATKTLVQGVDVAYPKIRNYELNSGSFFTENQNKNHERIAVLGSQMTDKLFENQNAIGETIFINKIPFVVIGTLAPKGSTAKLGNIDNVVMIPIKTMMRRIMNVDYLSKIYLQVSNQNALDFTEKEIISVLRNNHKLDNLGKNDDFTISNQIDAIRTINETSQTFSFLTLGVAAISLIIGGAGILAVMVLSVRERIMEIGLRISVGARKWQILLQFLTESFLLAAFGGLVGVALGCISALLLNMLSSWETLISLQPIMISLVFSIAIGLIFGVFPAFRASNLNPIIALKSDS